MRFLENSANFDQKSFIGKIFASAFFLFFGLAGAVFLVFLAKTTLSELRSYGWEEAKGLIVHSERVSSPEGKYILRLAYEYEYNGKKYRGETFSEAQVNFNGKFRQVAEAEKRYASGTFHAVYVNPASPWDAVLERQFSWWMLIGGLIPLVFCFIGFGGLYGCWFMKKTNDLHKTRPPVIGTKGVRSGAGSYIFLGVVVLFCAALTIFMFILPAGRTIAARSWESIPCRIVSSRVTSHDGSEGGTTYGVEIIYQYDVGGRSYVGDRYDFLACSSSGYEGKVEIVRRYPAGKKTICQVNPRDAYEAVLSTEFRSDYWFGLIPLAFVAFGGLGMFFVWRRSRHKKIEHENIELEDAIGVCDSFLEEGGWLKPRNTPLKMFLGGLLFALIWNGLVSVFVTIAVKSWVKGEPEWFLSIFIIPFVLIGMLTIVFFLFSFADLFVEAPRVRLSKCCPCLGDKVMAEWEIAGSRAYRHMSINVEGVQKIRMADKEARDKVCSAIFVLIPLLETDLPEVMSGGRKEFELPGDMMHSFKAPNHKIVWRVKLCGRRRYRPALTCEYEFCVMPLPQGGKSHVAS